MILQRISSRRARRSTNFTIKYWTVYVQYLVGIFSFFKISSSTLRFGANSRATAWGFILANTGLRRLQKDGNEQELPKVARFDAVRTTRSENTNRSKRHIQFAHMAGLDTLWSRITLLSGPAATLVRMKVHVFSDSTVCVGVSNPNPSEIWAINWRTCGTNTDLSKR